MPIIGDNARSFREAWQCRDMSVGVVINHFDAVPTSMCDENAAALGIEGSMVEGAACSSRDLDYAYGLSDMMTS